MLSLSEILLGQSLLLTFGFLIGASILAIITYANARLSRFLAFSFSFLGCIFGLISGSAFLLGYEPSAPLLLSAIPGLGSLSLGLDPLSAFFVILISIVGAAVSVYSFGYMDEYEKKGYSSALFGFLFSIFLLSMIAVLVSQNALLFLIFWEVMALSSYFLVTYENQEEGAKKAGFSYLLITHVGAAALILMFLAFAGAAGSLDFASFRSASFTPLIANVIFISALIAFGSKAGIVPLHIWLPEAHPQAPSNISALMSGVMLKVAIYGLIRVIFDFLAPTGLLSWWGILVIALGAISSVLGVLYALTQRDLKRLLAFSSVENIGIIFIGIGASVLFYHANLPALAALALFASIYHSLNHSLFKSLLFLGAGSILHSTHTKDIDKLGGLIKKMPVTAFLFFIGSVAISAIPPLNGFASEWFTFQSLFAGLKIGGMLPLFFGASIIFLAITSALAVAAFVNAFGITFLGAPRSKNAEEAHEVNFSMHLGMGILAILCILAGIFPSIIYSLISPVLKSLKLADLTGSTLVSNTIMILPSFNILIVITLVSIIVVGIFLLIRKSGNPRIRDEVRVTWDCGIDPNSINSNMEYTSMGLAMPIKRVFNSWLNPLNNINAYGSAFFESTIYMPLVSLFRLIYPLSAVFQSGKLTNYLMYMLVVLVVILVYVISM